MTTIGPTLTTARLILRPPQHEDFDGFASMAPEEDTLRVIVAARRNYFPSPRVRE